jgi:hypothetical protein
MNWMGVELEVLVTEWAINLGHERFFDSPVLASQ